ncbi:ABC transporter substrate-binding protein [Brachybacterium sacelli]|uniref:Multiple sugar transport system substrate-binding protein n=1 Tax=Brachybacterium sacelli TaxID=173364 RepID=A0ABS4WZ81_9MICO|nr:multiple sugar transport system substrate-binding protein [Brachybacterium sacelli]
MGSRGGGSGAGAGEVRATWWGGDSENSALNAALDALAQETGTKVARETQAWDGYWDRLATQTAGGNAPDLIMQAGSQIPDYAERGTLLDLNTQETLDVEAIDEGLEQFGLVGDQLYGVVAASNAMGLVARDDLVGQAGLSLPGDDYDWEELAQIAVSAHDALGDEIWGLQDGGGDLILFVMKVRDDGRQFYADDGTLNATPEDLTAWLQYWQDLRDAGGAPPADVTAEGQGELPNTALAQGRAAMGFGWTQDYVAYARLSDSSLSLHLPPHVPATPSLWMNAASLWSVSSTSSVPDAAVELINQLTNSTEAIEALGISLGIPPSEAAREQLTGSLSAEEQIAMDYMSTVAEVSTPLNRLWPAGFDELRTLLGDLNEAVAFGDLSIPDAVDQFFTTATDFT